MVIGTGSDPSSPPATASRARSSQPPPGGVQRRQERRPVRQPGQGIPVGLVALADVPGGIYEMEDDGPGGGVVGLSRQIAARTSTSRTSPSRRTSFAST